MNAQQPFPGDAEQPLQVGDYSLTLHPHHIISIGARVLLIIRKGEDHHIDSISADDARRVAERLFIAACQAEAKGRRKS